MQALSWYLVAGIVLCAMAIAATLIRRLPLSTAMLYLPIGWFLGPYGLNAIPIHIATHAFAVEQITKAIILLSLFSAGLKMRLPITSHLWFLSLRLAFLSVLITVGLIALAGIFRFGLPAGIAILIGGILAVGLARTPLGGAEKGLIGWFGIRGIGSLYYLAYAVQHGLSQSRTETVANTVLAAIAVSVAMHGITVTPLMNWYGRRQEASSP